MLVGVGRALGLPEAAEGTADDTDVRDVDVAVDDERHGLAGETAPELVGGAAHVLDHGRALLGKQRGQLIGRQRVAVAGALDRARRQVVGEFALGSPPAAAPRDE